MNSRGNRGKVLFRSSFPLDSGGERERHVQIDKSIFFSTWNIEEEKVEDLKKMEDKERRWKIKEEDGRLRKKEDIMQVNENIFTSLWKITNEDEISRKNMEDLKKD